MCFSPFVSFAASAVLGVIGIATIRHAKSVRAMPFAAIQLLLAIQQCIEGLLWLNLLYHEQLREQNWLIQAYVVFAGIIWPVYVPVCMVLMESKKKRQQVMWGAMLSGFCFALYVLYAIFHIMIVARISNSCILYEHPALPFDRAILPMYLVATCGAFCISSHRRIRWLGWMTALAFLATYFSYHSYLVSVWCFFSAVVSGVIYFHYSDRQDSSCPEEGLA